MTHFIVQHSNTLFFNVVLVSLLTSILSLSIPVHAQDYWLKTQKPALQLAKTYQPNTDLSQYYVSEKLDGIRAYWNGKQLISRGGHIINTPNWFIKHFPVQPLDGELWIARKKFELVSSIVRSQNSNDKDWQKVQYMIFDLPADLSPFEQRLKKLQQLIPSINNQHITLIPQKEVASQQALNRLLTKITQNGGEGIMLHRKNSLYQTKRSTDMLKLKPYHDEEATVLAYIDGKGKYTGLMGAIEVINSSGIRFKIGSGFSDKERHFPPPIGSTITYRYRGKTKNNIPRFATYLRQRHLK